MADKEADKQIVDIKAAGTTSRATVVKKLLGAVFDVKPVAPEQD